MHLVSDNQKDLVRLSFSYFPCSGACMQSSSVVPLGVCGVCFVLRLNLFVVLLNEMACSSPASFEQKTEGSYKASRPPCRFSLMLFDKIPTNHLIHWVLNSNTTHQPAANTYVNNAALFCFLKVTHICVLILTLYYVLNCEGCIVHTLKRRIRIC
jgi:hypothetical protein